MNLELNNKVVFIVGSSRGIGFEIAKQFLAEGAYVAISGRNAVLLEEAYNRLRSSFSASKILKINGDLQQESCIQDSLESVLSHFGQIDCVIANIGSGAEKRGLDYDATSLLKSYEINLLSGLLIARHACTIFKQQKHGNLIFISSITGVEDINAPIPYSVHKAGVIAASKKLAREVGPFGIRVNTLVPGNILFEGGTWQKKMAEAPAEVQQYVITEVPLQCFGDPLDVANAAVFLASNKAKFITGATVKIDGGQTKSY